MSDQADYDRERDAHEDFAVLDGAMYLACPRCQRPHPSVSSRMHCDACRAESERDAAIARAETAGRERDEARARLADVKQRDPGCECHQEEGDSPCPNHRDASEMDAATDAFGTIAELCGCPSWDYPGQVVRDVERLRSERDEARAAVVAMREAIIMRDADRKHVGEVESCRRCDRWWLPGGPENHGVACPFASDAGAPLLAELARLQGIETAARAVATGVPRRAAWERLRAALDAKAGS